MNRFAMIRRAPLLGLAAVAGVSAALFLLATGSGDDLAGPTETDAARGSSQGRGREWLKKLVPWIGASLVLGYLFSQVPVSETWEAARGARLELFLMRLGGSRLQSLALGTSVAFDGACHTRRL